MRIIIIHHDEELEHRTRGAETLPPMSEVLRFYVQGGAEMCIEECSNAISGQSHLSEILGGILMDPLLM